MTFTRSRRAARSAPVPAAAVLAVSAAMLAVVVGVAACQSDSAPTTSRTPTAPTSTGTSPGTGTATTSQASGGPTTVLLSHLDGATVPTSFILDDDTPGVTEAKFYLTTGGSADFLARAKTAPFTTTISVAPGPNSIMVRQSGNGANRVTVSFTASAALTNRQGHSPTAPTAGPVTTPPATFTTPAPTVEVNGSSQLADALTHAGPDTVIHLTDGNYINGHGRRWQLSASGTAGHPITLEGDRGAVLESDSVKGDYALWITGSYWQVTGISIRNATKGIVLDGSQHTIINNVDVGNIGEEGVHLRTCSSDDVLQNSFIHDTGLEKPQFGEGVYVGSANSNWSKYNCVDGKDHSERNLIRNNAFKHIAAEGADLKEGTDSGTLTGNTFLDTGYSGQNSADSAVDVKGNGWVITNNTAGDPQGADQDAFQTHALYSGYGTGNTFSNNTVTGTWPGFGFGLFPQAGNTVSCNNTAPGAAQGLVGNENNPASCTP